jgi:hypothetical protein
MKNKTLNLLNEIIAQQEKTLFDCGRRIVPNLTAEDILQPYDYPELENNGHFRYEEGVLAGLMTALTALRALHNEDSHDKL